MAVLNKTGLERLWLHIVSNLNKKVDKVEGKGLSTNDYTTAEKTKLAGIAEGANKTVVDSVLSETSTNPVENKAVNAALAGKSDTGHTHDDRYYTETEVDTKLSGKSDTDHTQAASTITAGTFAGAVVAQTSSQTPETSLLRNSKLVTTDTDPSYNGEICWTYE